MADRYSLTAVDRAAREIPRWELPAVVIAEAGQEDLEEIERMGPEGDDWRFIVLLEGETPPRLSASDRVFILLPRCAPRVVIEKSVERCFESMQAREERRQARRELHRAAADLEALNRIGVALSAERDAESLLSLILTRSREITGADAGSIYLVEEEAQGARRLIFKLIQSDSHDVPFREFTLPIDHDSAAGYAAAHGEILNLPDAYRIRHQPFRHNRDFDRRFGYRTRSMLVVPMKNQKGEVIGVLQLINAKKDARARLVSEAAVDAEVIAFSERSQDLAASLASQAAVALENSVLYRDIQQQFEGFVRASVTAIELRDPSTCGHSERVATLTQALAELVDRADAGPYKEVRFSRDDLQELRYAALLHDFGKVGVRESVLVKANKLYPSQVELIKERFRAARKGVELESAKCKLSFLLGSDRSGLQAFFATIDATERKELKRLDDFLAFVLEANSPAHHLPDVPLQLAELAASAAARTSDGTDPLLRSDEIRLLSIPRGTLDDRERAEIESHVRHSVRFLSQIPWTRELRHIPEFARAHHEKLDGSGYPDHTKADRIPCQARIMTIADIFDALTAADRPYKRAVPVERALDVLARETESNQLDPALFRLFADAKVYQLTAPIR
ncbi:MAG TPA: HD domain-containing phosphohydrolase [Terriglobia bacterium]|nr:HD domain-containing phosphohydrolase [Terriglobia bacterium]